MKSFFQKNPLLKPVAIVFIAYLFIGLFISISIKRANVVPISEKEQRVPDDDAEVHPAKTYLRVENGNDVVAYYARLETKNTLMNLFDYHMEVSGLTFEKISYTYGLALDNVNGLKAPGGFEWRVYDDETDITYDLKGIGLKNEHTYSIRLEPIQ